jgi:hypothetical protein
MPVEENRMNRWMLAGMVAFALLLAFPATLQAG